MLNIPAALYVGDTLDFTSSGLTDYPASQGWTLKVRLAPRAAGTTIDLTASADGDDHHFAVAASSTAGYVAGWYTYTAYAEKASERYTVQRGQIQVKPASAAIAAGTDTRSHARKVLDAIEAVIEGRATVDQQEYAIGNRSLKRMEISELLKLRQVYRNEVAGEEAADRLAAGLGTARKVQVRL